MKDDELLHKWIAGDLSGKELEKFRERPEYGSLVDLYKNTDDLVAPSLDEAAMLQDILKQKKASVTPAKESRRIFLSSWIKYGVAASVLLLATWWFWSGSSNQVLIEVAKGERQEGILPGQSTFVVNAESVLSYNVAQWEKERFLNLKGEAFFDVKKGSSFKVTTPNGMVEVLGTKFNVRARKKILEVTCQSGKVAVFNTKKEKLVELGANEVVRIMMDEVSESWATNTVDNTWKDGVFRFRKVPLFEVLEELERQFDIRIDRNGVNELEVISCNFQGQKLDIALKTSLAPLNIQYEITTDGNVKLIK